MSNEKIPPIEVQKKLIKDDMEISVPKEVGKKWFVVNREWMKKWRLYVGLDNSTEVTEHPGEINNSSLLISTCRVKDKNFKKLVRFLTQNDYILVNYSAFTKLKKWYGCDYDIERYSIPHTRHHSHYEVEVYPLQITLKCEKEQSVGKDEFLKTPNFIEREIVCSRHLLFRTFYETVGNFFKLEKNSFNLWLACNNIPYRILGFKEFCDIRLSEIICRVYEQEICVFKKLSESEKVRKEVVFHLPSKEKPVSSCYRNNPAELRGGTPVKTIPTLCGLKDLGNSCYMSASLQCLSRLKLIHPYFLKPELFLPDINKKNPLGLGGRMVRAFSRLVRQMWSGKYGYLYPREVKNVIQRFNPRFEGKHQQDVSEFTINILSLLHEDLKKDRYIHLSPSSTPVSVGGGEEEEEIEGETDVSNPFSPKNISRAREIASEEDEEIVMSPLLPIRLDASTASHVDKSWAHYFNVEGTSIINTTFYGQSKSIKKCETCNQISPIFAPFNIIRLPVPDSGEIFNFRFYHFENKNTPEEITLKGIMEETNLTPKILKSQISRILKKQISNIVLVSYHNEKTYILKYDEKIDVKNKQRIVAYEIPDVSRKLEEGKFIKISVISTETSSNSLELIDPFLVYVTPSSTIKDIFTQCCNYMWHFMDKKFKDVFKVPNTELFFDDAISTSISIQSADDLFELFLMDDNMTKLDYRKTKNEIFRSTEFENYFLEKGIILDISAKTVRTSYDKTRFTGFSKRIEYCGFRNLDIYNLLEKYTQTYEKSDFSKQCGSCKKSTRFSEKVDFWRLPKVLIIQFLRFKYVDFWEKDKTVKKAVKVQEKVDFPLKQFKMGTFSPNKNQQKKVYSLRGVCNHHGGQINFGHYTANVKFKNSDGKEIWVRVNNEKHDILKDESEVVTDNAYLLFYELDD